MEQVMCIIAVVSFAKGTNRTRYGTEGGEFIERGDKKGFGQQTKENGLDNCGVLVFMETRNSELGHEI